MTLWLTTGAIRRHVLKKGCQPGCPFSWRLGRPETFFFFSRTRFSGKGLWQHRFSRGSLPGGRLVLQTGSSPSSTSRPAAPAARPGQGYGLNDGQAHASRGGFPGGFRVLRIRAPPSTSRRTRTAEKGEKGASAAQSGAFSGAALCCRAATNGRIGLAAPPHDIRRHGLDFLAGPPPSDSSCQREAQGP
ncbi:hypothetical protein VTN02DRAFT_784 [Thermoascus thermophilus]